MRPGGGGLSLYISSLFLKTAKGEQPQRASMTKKAKPKSKNEVPGAPVKQGSSAGSGQQGVSAQPPAAPQTAEAPPAMAEPSSLAQTKPQEQTPSAFSAAVQPPATGTPSITAPVVPHTTPTTSSKPVVEKQIKSPQGSPAKTLTSTQQQEKVQATFVAASQLPTATQKNQTVEPSSVAGTAKLPAGQVKVSAGPPSAEISSDKTHAAAHEKPANEPPSVSKTSVSQSPPAEAKPQGRPSAMGNSPPQPQPSSPAHAKQVALSDAHPLTATQPNPPSVPHPTNAPTTHKPAVTQAKPPNRSSVMRNNSAKLPTAVQPKNPGKLPTALSTATTLPEKHLDTDLITSQQSTVTQTKPAKQHPITTANISDSCHSDIISKQNVGAHEPYVEATNSTELERDLQCFAPEQLPDLMPVKTAGQDKVPEDFPPEIVSAVIKEALSEKPIKKPTEKQKNREKPIKQPVATKSEVADKITESKSIEAAAIKGKVASVKTMPTQLKDKPKEQPIKKDDKKHSSDSDSFQPTAVTLSSGITEATVEETTNVKEKLPTVAMPKDAKSSIVDTKMLGPEPPPHSATNEPRMEVPVNKEGNKITVGKKHKQKSGENLVKTEPAPGSKKSKSEDHELKNQDVSITETKEKITGETNKVKVVEAKKTSLKQGPDKAKKPEKVEAAASDGLPQSKQENSKAKQQNKATQDSQETKTPPAKEDQQSKSTSKKRNKQQQKSSSEDIKISENKETKVIQESVKPKGTEKGKPKSASINDTHKTPIASPQIETTYFGNIPRENALNNGFTTAQSPEMGPTVPKQGENEQAMANEQEIRSNKKKRNRHKKKKLVEDGKGTANVAYEETKTTVVSSESKAKEKSSAKSPQDKEQQKDARTQQSNKKKGKQPAPAVGQDEESLKKEVSSGEESQTIVSKKRKRRKKKVAENDKNADKSKPEACDNKSSKQDEPSEPKLSAFVEGAQKKNDSISKPNLGNDDKRTDSQITVTETGNVDGEDQQEKFVEVKSKSKRSKKSKLSDTQRSSVFISSTSSDVPNSNTQTSSQVSIVIDEEEEKPAVTGDRTKFMTNKVAAPKLSPEAREQKILKKKLAERAQQKIQQQIESNCLSEAEKSEKYLETITKNLKELTKLRSSKLEDILQKSAADGEEEFDYEYSPVQRTTFLATTCHICKESKPKENLRICNLCHMISYCSEDHQKSDWPTHKDFCQAVSEICKERGTDSLFAPAVGLTADDYRAYRMNALLECAAILNRPLEPFEQEMILYPNICQTCHLPAPAKLQTCDKCEMMSYCYPEHRQPNHDLWCTDLQLFKGLIVYQSRNGVINPELPEYYPETTQVPVSDMQSLIQALFAGRDASLLERTAISEMATGPLTTLFALYKANKIHESTEKLVVHFVGAEWSFELERADKWEAFLLHLVPSLKTLVLVFVGPEVASLPEEAMKLVQKQSRACSRCQDGSRKVELTVAKQLFYHEYAASANYVKPDVICAFNAGLYRHNGYKEVDSWADTLGVLLKDPDVPLAVTSYTAEEMLKDVERLQQRSSLNFLLAPSQNPYRSLRPNRNFASDDVTPVIFKNFYITIATSPVS